eukprot:TRINITY_DN32599_c0_g1_i1.p2 TRINITY_DN32599_c0_g1~~TRINITY_DN32599_c0_g1_i1.p2  ORF type:complete len:101 (+),score=12.29 TRINITY_DN32599_c0_g1_i1:142-444(+)
MTTFYFIIFFIFRLAKFGTKKLKIMRIENSFLTLLSINCIQFQFKIFKQIQQQLFSTILLISVFISLGEIFVSQSQHSICLLYTSPSPRDRQKSRMPSSA